MTRTPWAAVLAGGSGSRFWPLSTPARPKQMLPLAADETPLIVDSVRRLTGLIPPERVVLVTAERLVAETRRLLPDVPAENVLAEPRAASTGPALAWATHAIQRRDSNAVVLSMHADWWVGSRAAFQTVAKQALDAAESQDALVTVGVLPTRPDTSYGYIEPGGPIAEGLTAVQRFTEKPNAVRAAQLVVRGALWNSGLFAWTPERFRAEAEAHAPELANALPRLDADDVAGFFAAVQPIAVDVSHYERSHRVVCVAGRFDWDDVGTWAALHRVRPADAQRNVIVGRGYARRSVDTTIWVDDGVVVVDGVKGLVVVRANGVTLVTTRERAADLKELLADLPDDVRDLR
ncbi:MAG: sugar phosphate nucleotidyltransferase [Gemmatimonadales bacterium]